MGKRLLQRDYDQIVFDAYNLPESDFYKYYSNITDENQESNDDIFQELISAVNRQIDWYRNLHKRDYTYEGSTWEVDEAGNRTRLNPDETSIPLPWELGIRIRTHINKSFFDEQIRIINGLSDLHKVGRGMSILTGIKTKLEERLKLLEKPTRGRRPQPAISYRELFRDPQKADLVKEIFEKQGYTKNNKWIKDLTNPNRSNNDSELLCAFYVLRPLFKNHYKTPASIIFYNEFEVTPLSNKMMSTKPEKINDLIPFQRIFSDLLKSN
jgi:hypothetical protein